MEPRWAVNWPEVQGKKPGPGQEHAVCFPWLGGHQTQTLLTPTPPPPPPPVPYIKSLPFAFICSGDG